MHGCPHTCANMIFNADIKMEEGKRTESYTVVLFAFQKVKLTRERRFKMEETESRPMFIANGGQIIYMPTGSLEDVAGHVLKSPFSVLQSTLSFITITIGT